MEPIPPKHTQDHDGQTPEMMICFFMRGGDGVFTVDNKKIGDYLAHLIEQNYPSTRQFCIAYLSAKGEENAPENSIDNAANRFAQIKKGKKGIQCYDLPILAELLGVTIEQILSGGEVNTAQTERPTNYSVAQSHTREDWEAYVAREDRPILNSDEYGKTLLDYAVANGNYELLKYLIDRKYIWFDSGKKEDYGITFGAGTSIRRRPLDIDQAMIIQLHADVELREELICLAADHGDIALLKELRAREIPEFYLPWIFNRPPEVDPERFGKPLKHISRARKAVVAYFTEEFAVSSLHDGAGKERPNKQVVMVFPYLPQLLDLMVVRKSRWLAMALEGALEHNKQALRRMKELIQATIESYCMENAWEGKVRFTPKTGMLSYFDPLTGGAMLTNLIHVTKTSGDSEIQDLIEQVNDAYNACCSLAKE